MSVPARRSSTSTSSPGPHVRSMSAKPGDRPSRPHPNSRHPAHPRPRRTRHQRHHRRTSPRTHHRHRQLPTPEKHKIRRHHTVGLTVCWLRTSHGRADRIEPATPCHRARANNISRLWAWTCADLRERRVVADRPMTCRVVGCGSASEFLGIPAACRPRSAPSVCERDGFHSTRGRNHQVGGRFRHYRLQTGCVASGTSAAPTTSQE